MNLDYNTTRNHLEIKEYGRHIQKMIEYSITIEEDAKRQKAAETIVELMAYFNPQLRSIENYKKKLWDHLFLISDFKLKVNSPYTILTKEEILETPKKLPYPRRYPKFLHLGKNIEFLVDKAKNESNEEKKQFYIHIIIYCMKQAYMNWHKEGVQEETLKTELQILTKDALIYDFSPEIKKILETERNEKEYKKQNIKTELNAQNQINKNYNNSSSSNVSHAVSLNRNKKNKFKRKY